MYIFKQCAPGLIPMLRRGRGWSLYHIHDIRGRCNLITFGVEKARHDRTFKQTTFKTNTALFLSRYGLSLTSIFAVSEIYLPTYNFLS